MSSDFSDYMNFLSPETARKIQESIKEREQTDQNQEKPETRKSLFYDLRPARLETDPEETADGWSADFTFVQEGQNINSSSDQETAKFRVYFVGDGVPECHKDDVIYVAFRGRYTAVCKCDPDTRYIWISGSSTYGLNSWLYQVQEVQLVYEDSGLRVKICDIPGQGVNLLELNNLDTGMLGIGIDITNDQNIDQLVNVNHINPVPNGVVVESRKITRLDTGVPCYIFQFGNPLSTGWGHVVRTLDSEFSGSKIFSIGGKDVVVTCPLLEGKTLPKGTKVIISQNFETTEWEIVEAQCDSASAAPLPGEGEDDDEEADPEFQDDSVIADEPSAGSPEGEE
ncbi:MAG: hypothetical protein IK105_09275 [Thermoguttaceae bacterium]|nr:hypothetical protein [Thermoguttaceae bacterium]